VGLGLVLGLLCKSTWGSVGCVQCVEFDVKHYNFVYSKGALAAAETRNDTVPDDVMLACFSEFLSVTKPFSLHCVTMR